MTTRYLSNAGELHMAHDVGYVSGAALDMSVNPTITETVTIGSDVYEFDGSGGNINVAIGIDWEATRTNLVTAINGSGTENVLADEDGMFGATTLRIQAATAPGGAIVIGTGPDIALSETMSAGTCIWQHSNLNETGSPAYSQMARGKVVVDAQMLLGLGYLWLEFPFTVAGFEWQAYDSAGIPKPNTVETTSFLKIVGWGLIEGVSPLIATDYIVFTIFGE